MREQYTLHVCASTLFSSEIQSIRKMNQLVTECIPNENSYPPPRISFTLSMWVYISNLIDFQFNKLVWPNCAVIFWPLATTKLADERFVCSLRVDMVYVFSTLWLLRAHCKSCSSPSQSQLISLSFYLLRYTFSTRTYLKFGTQQLITNAMSFVS